MWHHSSGGLMGIIIMRTVKPVKFEKLDNFSVGGYSTEKDKDLTDFDFYYMEGNGEKDKKGYITVTCELDDFVLGEDQIVWDKLDNFKPEKLVDEQLTEVHYEADFEGKEVPMKLMSFSLKYYDHEKDDFIYYDFSDKNIAKYNRYYSLNK